MSDIAGVFVALPDCCRNCGGNTAFVGGRQLLCDGCDCGRGLISPELRSFLEKYVEQFGRPDQPIVLRTGKVHKPEQPAPAAETETDTKPKRKRKG